MLTMTPAQPFSQPEVLTFGHHKKLAYSIYGQLPCCSDVFTDFNDKQGQQFSVLNPSLLQLDCLSCVRICLHITIRLSMMRSSLLHTRLQMSSIHISCVPGTLSESINRNIIPSQNYLEYTSPEQPIYNPMDQNNVKAIINV